MTDAHQAFNALEVNAFGMRFQGLAFGEVIAVAE
jgi:hypothetical protein